MACLLAALGLALIGGVGLARAGNGTTTRALTVDGVPLLEISPAARTPGRPGVVIAHGFSGSATLMRGLADTLVARGYVAVIPDFAGHGRSTGRLDVADGRVAAGTLQHDLAVAVRHLRGLPVVDAARIAIVGHSMGADAALAYAVEHPQVRATVAISPTSTESLPTDPARPRDLLLVVGALEFPAFRAAALTALHRSGSAASFGTTSGDPAAGTARRASLIPGVEHVSVLFATRTHTEITAWLDRALPATVPAAPRPRDRLVPAALLLLAFALGFVPLTAALLPRRAARARTAAARPMRRVHAGYAYGGLAVALALGAVGARLLPAHLLPLAVGSYAAGFFAIAGLVLLCGYTVAGRSLRRPVPGPPAGPRRWAVAVVLVGYAAAAVVVPVHLGLTHAVPVGPRWWLLPVLVGCVALALLGVELFAAGIWWRRPLALAAVAAALLAAALAGLAPGYVLLVLPLLTVLLGWHAAWSAWLSRLAAPAWLSALVGATVVGWPIATALPLTG